jgi:hypothetical protein
MVFLAGLPGTGKSLLIHGLAHTAHASGREVHLLQWDVVRPVFEASPAGRRYPPRDGVTQPLIRMAAGEWARRAVAVWLERHPGPAPLLIGETPLAGHRFIELARRMDDAAESHLAAPSCRFLVPVPSVEVRRAIEEERGRRMSRPQHDREREDAPPQVLNALWEEIVIVAHRLGIDAGEASPRLGIAMEHSAPESVAQTNPAATSVTSGRPYDPALYAAVYRKVLAHRHAEILSIERVLPSASPSVYEFTVPTHEVIPGLDEAAESIHAVEARYPGLDGLRSESDRWYIV